MALDFPSPAVEGQTFTASGATFIYHNGRWMMVGQEGSGDGGGGGDFALIDDPDPHLGNHLILNGFTIPGLMPGVDTQPYSAVLTATTAVFLLADEAKLDALPTAAQYATDLAAKANLAGGAAFSGVITVPNVAYPDNSSKVANTAYVTAAIAASGAGLDTEAVQDIVGAMVTGNTETNITVTYDDATGKLNFAATGSGTGDVVGPASSTADAPTLFDGTTGKLLKQTTYALFKASLALTQDDVGLTEVDNTSDTAKPVSTAQQAALDLKANLAGGAAFSGNITVPNVTAGDNSTKAANSAFVTGAIATFNTSNNAALALKAPLDTPTFTGTVVVPNVTWPANNQQAANTAFVTAAIASVSGTDTTKVLKTGDTMSGLLQFSGTTHAGLKLLSLTTAQRDALTPAVGMMIYNTTLVNGQMYAGTAWANLGVTGPNVQTVLDDVLAAAGAPATAMSTTLNSLIAITAAPLVPATAAQHWAGTDGYYMASPQSIKEMWVTQTLTVSGGTLTVNGAAFQHATVAPISADLSINSVSGMTQDRVLLDIPATGATRNVTVPGFDYKTNIGTVGIPIPAGSIARFEMWGDGTNDSVRFLGYNDRGWAPEASTRLAYDANRLPVLLTAADETTALLATSQFKAKNVVVVELALGTDFTSNITVGDGKDYFTIPAALNGFNLTRAQATLVTAGTGTSMLVQIHNKTSAVDVLSTRITVAASALAGTVGVIDAANDGAVTDHVWRVDVDQVLTGGKGGTVILEFTEP